jgi:hypothetical protein
VLEARVAAAERNVGDHAEEPLPLPLDGYEGADLDILDGDLSAGLQTNFYSLTQGAANHQSQDFASQAWRVS